ncbi:hypothetical protein DEU56DRAFT_753224 [Suillus clintonianus]|uniref:uncharacterized protein n=1 Tax=Suillus clintonianus TaxID=1904413 RepID=UPI001B873568|nr:uncharacterized protein DEU56DRAFT_753224 [Suillus clintonianus]KAG2147959.1 hypothetical protein DEU56DRAFT_753224 [Suillus clintonianus]
MSVVFSTCPDVFGINVYPWTPLLDVLYPGPHAILLPVIIHSLDTAYILLSLSLGPLPIFTSLSVFSTREKWVEAQRTRWRTHVTSAWNGGILELAVCNSEHESFGNVWSGVSK